MFELTKYNVFIFCVSFISVGIVLYLLTELKNFIKQIIILRYAESYYAIMNTAIQYAYSFLYKNEILAQKVNGTMFSKNEVDGLRVRFVDLVKKIIGPNIINALVTIHGTEIALDMLLVLKFDDLLDQDLVEEKEKEG